MDTEDITNLKSLRYILLDSILDDIIQNNTTNVKPEDFKLIAQKCMMVFQNKELQNKMRIALDKMNHELYSPKEI